MSPTELLRDQSQAAFAELEGALEGVSQGQAWAVLPAGGAEYLHTDGSIHGVVLHVATAKRMYGSIAFRGGELTWRECAEQLDAFEPDWERARAYLEESQRYWLSTWAELRDADLEREVPHFSGKLVPAWRIVRTMIHHDSYHAGQIAVLRFALGETAARPPSAAADIREHCKDLPNW